MRLTPALAAACTVALIARGAAGQGVPSAPAAAADTAVVRDTTFQPEELRAFLAGTFGPRPTARALGLAGFDQWRGRPESFPRTWRGFEDRLGARYAQVAISHTIRFGLSRAVEQRTVRYRLCECGDSVSRLSYALLSPLRVSTPRGIRMSMLNPVSEIASGILVTAVRPGGFRLTDGVKNGITGLAAESLTSVVREFWPWHWRPPFL